MKMAFASLIPLLAFLLLHLLPSTSNLLSPIVDEVCKGVECGKGTCKASQNSTFFFECDCQPGWKQPLSNDDDSAFKFLPCIVPNCTLDYACAKAPAPVQEKAAKSNESSFHACRWIDCGGGSCNNTSMFSYNCECDAGYYNLLNVTAFPCFKECSLGMGCSELGISVTNSSSSAPPALNDNSKNEGSSILQGSYLRVAMVVLFMAMLQLQ
ncbi:protein lin-12 [Vigna radiata var. radiata]|uniref:Protein lin-12 n=1 Tax=Vigna radiata var. radiata TaxID=3916 RepID=A0A1S3V4Y9_VIGRR|nr:protein lin-12 [Vigna radiata var. radiata]